MGRIFPHLFAKKDINSMKIFLRILMVSLTTAWMAVIFYMSAADGNQSDEMSLSVGEFVGKVVYSDYEEWTEPEQTAFAEKVDHPIRKGGHFTEFTILGGLLILTFFSFGRFSRKTFFASWMLGTVYAATDEFHQLFVSGRSGQITDILIDSGGVIFGCIILIILLKKIAKARIMG